MDKLTPQQENNQLIGIIGADTSNKILKKFIRDSVEEKIYNDSHNEILEKQKLPIHLKSVK